MDGSFEKIPYFSLPSNDLNDVIAPSCYSCFDYVNGLADLVSAGPCSQMLASLMPPVRTAFALVLASVSIMVQQALRCKL